MAVDQAHEQNNVTIKGDGGVIGQTHNAEALKRCSLVSPEVARVITDFKATVDSTSAAEQAAPKRHPEQTKAFQKRLIKYVKSLEQVITAMCNPFADYGKVLFRLHTMEVLPEAAVLCTERLQEAGLEQYESYVNERLVTHTKSVFKPIEKNRLELMAPTIIRQIKTPQEKALQDTCSTLAQLYVASEVRVESSDEFFSHENQIYPPSLLENGNLRSNTKSDLVTLLEKTANEVVPGELFLGNPCEKF